MSTARTRLLKSSPLEDELVTLLAWAKLPTPEREYQPVPGRRFRVDLAYPDLLLAVEVEGGIYSSRGGHSSVTGLLRDIEKHTAIALAGWVLLRVGEKHIRSGQALEWIEEGLKQAGARDRQGGPAAFWRRKSLDAEKVLADQQRYIRSLEGQLPKGGRA